MEGEDVRFLGRWIKGGREVSGGQFVRVRGERLVEVLR